MASITDLAIQLSTGRCIAWIGSGPSIEAGLPSWKKLANEVLEACRRDQRRGFNAIEAFYREEKYPEMFDQVERSYGRPFLVAKCSSLVRDIGVTTPAYEALANLGFMSYFTTNYDDVLSRHIKQAGKAFKKYLNSPDDLSVIDVDTTPVLWKLHGELSDPDSAVLTRGDYQRWYRSGEGNGFRIFLRSFLARDRFVFVGYSMSDPEVLQLQEEVQTDLRRQVRSIAILANVPDHERERWRLDYNIDILPYRAADNDHSELSAILTSVYKALSIGSPPKDIKASDELKRAESLYLWYRFSPGHGETATIDALQSVILNVLVECPDGMTVETISAHIASDLGTQTAVYDTDLRGSLDHLVESGWIVNAKDKYSVEAENEKIIRAYERRFEDMVATLEQQVTLDAVNMFQVDEQSGPRFAKLLVETLIDIFQTRGREILRVAFEESSISPSGALDLIEIVWKRASYLPDPAERPVFVHFVLTTMFEPKGIYSTVLNYFAKVFFCIQALGANKHINSIVSDVISDRALLVDANVLIPLSALNEDRHDFVLAVIEACKAAGIRLYTTKLALDEVRRHASWALRMTEEFGTLSPEVLYAATGRGDYEANAFLKGFIAVDPSSRDRSFLNYLRDCFGGSYAYEFFQDFFQNRLGITVLGQETITNAKDHHRQEYDEAVAQIDHWNMQRKEEERKSSLRVDSEAESFIVVTRWNTIKESLPTEVASRCSYLTYGTTVGRLGTTLRDSGGMVSVQPEVVWEVLTTLNGRPVSGLPDFRSLMSASYFRMSDHFVDKERYRTFFRPVIDAAKAKLQGMHPFVQEVLGISLTDEYLEGYDTEDLPAVLTSLEGAASRKASLDEDVARRAIDENESLRAQLREFQEREARRKEFVAEQRRRDRERRARRGRR